MKLLLTSGGVTNDSIASALNQLTGKNPADTKIAFIPTAANPDRGNKDWLIKDLYRLNQRGYQVDIIDLPAFKRDTLLAAVSAADIIFVGGGNTFYLSYWMKKSGLMEALPKLLETRVYAGISAGSMIAGKSLKLSSQALNNPAAFEDEDYDEIGPSGESAADVLGFVDIVFRPHLNSRFFTRVDEAALREKAAGLAWPVYALDDNSALKIVDGEIEVATEGEWISITPQ